MEWKSDQVLRGVENMYKMILEDTSAWESLLHIGQQDVSGEQKSSYWT